MGCPSLAPAFLGQARKRPGFGAEPHVQTDAKPLDSRLRTSGMTVSKKKGLSYNDGNTVGSLEWRVIDTRGFYEIKPGPGMAGKLPSRQADKLDRLRPLGPKKLAGLRVLTSSVYIV